MDLKPGLQTVDSTRLAVRLLTSSIRIDRVTNQLANQLAKNPSIYRVLRVLLTSYNQLVTGPKHLYPFHIWLVCDDHLLSG